MSSVRPNAWGIVDGMKTATARYYKFRGEDGEVWFSGQSWIESEKGVRQQIHAATGTMISRTAAMAELRTQIDEWSDFRLGVVAEHPGWLRNTFVCGDGTYRVAEGQPAPDVVAFKSIPKFDQQGTAEDWRRKMAPFVSGQPLPFFACCLALSGPLLRLLPAGIVPPQMEFFGEPKSGKSTVGVLAASIWAGVPERTEGGGENWDMTPNAYDVHRRNHRDMFLLLDEAGISDPSSKNRRDVAKAIIMKGATTSSKVRYNDVKAAPQIRVPILSTSNKSLQDVLQGAGRDTIAAATSRMMSIRITVDASGLPIFSSTPPGFPMIVDAVQALRAAANENYGSVGPEFAAGLVGLLASDENALVSRIGLGIETARRRMLQLRPEGDSRHRDMLAAVEVTGKLAQELGVLPESWGDPSAVADYIYSKCAANDVVSDSPVGRFISYLRQQNSARKLRRGWIMHIPLFHYTAPQYPIVLDKMEPGGIAYVDPSHFKSTFPGSHQFLVAMRRAGKLIRSGSEERSRLQIHAPKTLKRTGFKRVYAIRLDRDEVTAIFRS